MMLDKPKKWLLHDESDACSALALTFVIVCGRVDVNVSGSGIKCFVVYAIDESVV